MRFDANKPAKMARMASYLYGEMSPEQAFAFEESMGSSPKNNEMLAQTIRQKKQIDEIINSPAPSTDTAWNTLFSRLTDDNLMPQQESTTIPSVLSPWYRMVAAVALLVAIGATLMYAMVWRIDEIHLTTSSTDTGALVQTLSDGSVVYLAPNSELTFPKHFRGKYRKISLSGEAFFDIKSIPSNTFKIRTSSSLIEVMGTRFNLKSNDPHQIELVVESGKVRVSLHSDPTLGVLVQGGEMLTYHNSQLRKSIYLEQEPLGWRMERMQFKDATLGSILDVLNKNHNVVFTLTDPYLKERRITITLHDESPDTIASIICKTLSIESVTKQDTITLSP